MSVGFEIFKSSTPINAAEFYVYDVAFELCSDYRAGKDMNKEDSIVNMLNSLCRGLNMQTGFKQAVGKMIIAGNNYIISLGAIPEDKHTGLCYANKYRYILSNGAKKLLDIQKYKEYYIYYIKNMLKAYFRKQRGVYYIEDDTIYRENGLYGSGYADKIQDENGLIKLRKRYSFEIDIDKHNYILLQCGFGCEFLSSMNVAECWQRGIRLLGRKVRYTGNTSMAQVGVVVDENAGTVATYKIPNTNQTLKEYMLPRLRDWQKKKIEDVEDNCSVIKLRLNSGGEFVYYPQLCSPVYDFEEVRRTSEKFAQKVSRYAKMEMSRRIAEDRAFINEINQFKINSPHIGMVYFDSKLIDVEALSWREEILPAPQYLFSDGKIGYNKHECFKYGMYKDMIEGREKLNVMYLIPKGCDKEKYNTVKKAFFKILTNDNETNKDNGWLVKTFKNIHSKITLCEVYYDSDKDGEDVYNKIVKEKWDTTSPERQNIGKIDIALLVLPKGQDEKGKVYSCIKEQLKDLNIPSQAITYETAEIIYSAKNGYRYYIYNILLGVYCKLGGIPFILNNTPKDIDCFFGVDVAMAEKGIHYPACAAACLGDGSFLGWNMNVFAQTGEKIKNDFYRKLFTPFIYMLKEIYPDKKINVVVLRDGPFREDKDEFLALWEKHDINVSVFEIIKGDVERIWGDTVNMNPIKGTCIIKNDEAIIVTTSPGRNQGAPRPIRVRKVMGNIDIRTIAAQVYYLSEMHIGTTHTSRLPVPVDYADKICKARNYLPNISSNICKQMYFL